MDIILITGVNGYIGSNLARALILGGKQVIGLDLFSNNITDLNASSNFNFYTCDITDADRIPIEVREADILIHCAALVHKRASDLSRKNYFKINHGGTRNVLNILDPGKLKQIVFLSTVSIYGNLSEGQVPDETILPDPDDYYGESKVAAEDDVRRFSQKYRVPHTILRLAPVYGRSFLLNILKRAYLPRRSFFYRIGSGDQKVSLCSVNNVVDVVIAGLYNHSFFDQTFNVRDLADYSINDIIGAFKKFHSEQGKPVIGIPLWFPMSVFRVLSLFSPKKAEYYKYQLRKVAKDAKYSVDKLRNTGVSLQSDLNSTLRI